MTTQPLMKISMLALLALGISMPKAFGLGTIIPESPAHGLYGGIKVGPAYNTDLGDAWDDGSLSGQDTDDVSTAYELTVGYQINPYVSAEASHRNLGKSTMTAMSDGTGLSWDGPGRVEGEQEADGWTLKVSGRWPVSERWTLVGTFGWFWWESEEHYMEVSGASNIKESGSDFTFSGGFEFDHGNKDRIVYTAELGHQRVCEDNYDVLTGFAGVLYRFP